MARPTVPHRLPSSFGVLGGLHNRLTRSYAQNPELAWLLFIFIKMGLKLDTLNASSRAYSGFPADVRIPPFTEKLKKGNPSNSNPNP